VSGLPGGIYVRAGSFRLPYGLRLDDHTIYERVDVGAPYSVLGYDPRLPDTGIEVGLITTAAMAQAALTNGSGASFDPDRNKAFTARVAHWIGPALIGASVNLDSDGTSTVTERLRYGGYATWNPFPDLALLGALDLGEDEMAKDMTRLLLAWAEADYFFRRAARFRLRYEFLDRDRDEEYADSERYTIEGDWIPFPFTTFRLGYRFTSNEDTADREEVIGLASFSF
jgi:hypothetical protein